MAEANEEELAIEATALVRAYGEVRAVDTIDLRVPPGEVYGFLGPNGAGKSTVVRMLTTLLLPTQGRALVAGYDVVRDPTAVRLRIGAALQEAALDPKQTGRELLALQARLYGLRGREVKERVRDLAALVDIGDAMDHFIGTYSGGMKRRLDLAAALVHNPVVLFLDEPTTGLDPISRTKVWEEVRRINRDLGTTIFLTTQYLEEADQLAGRVGIINRGKIVAEGTPESLKHSVGSDVIVAKVVGEAALAAAECQKLRGVADAEIHGDEVTLSVAQGPAVIGPVAIALNACGVEVRELTLRTPTLDDVFLHYTGARLEAEATEEQSE
jgi:ABC-2 type transport system ATP-binding protein